MSQSFFMILIDNITMEQDIYAKKLASRNISIKCFEDKKNTNEKIIELNINTKSYLFRALVSSSK